MKNTDTPGNFTPEELYAVGIESRSVTHALNQLLSGELGGCGVMRDGEMVSVCVVHPKYHEIREPWHVWANMNRDQIIAHIETEIAIRNVTESNERDDDIFSQVRILPCAPSKPQP